MRNFSYSHLSKRYAKAVKIEDHEFKLAEQKLNQLAARNQAMRMIASMVTASAALIGVSAVLYFGADTVRLRKENESLKLNALALSESNNDLLADKLALEKQTESIKQSYEDNKNMLAMMQVNLQRVESEAIKKVKEYDSLNQNYDLKNQQFQDLVESIEQAGDTAKSIDNYNKLLKKYNKEFEHSKSLELLVSAQESVIEDQNFLINLLDSDNEIEKSDEFIELIEP